MRDIVLRHHLNVKIMIDMAIDAFFTTECRIETTGMRRRGWPISRTPTLSSNRRLNRWTSSSVNQLSTLEVEKLRGGHHEPFATRMDTTSRNHPDFQSFSLPLRTMIQPTSRRSEEDCHLLSESCSKARRRHFCLRRFQYKQNQLKTENQTYAANLLIAC